MLERAVSKACFFDITAKTWLSSLISLASLIGMPSQIYGSSNGSSSPFKSFCGIILSNDAQDEIARSHQKELDRLQIPRAANHLRYLVKKYYRSMERSSWSGVLETIQAVSKDYPTAYFTFFNFYFEDSWAEVVKDASSGLSSFELQILMTIFHQGLKYKLFKLNDEAARTKLLIAAMDHTRLAELLLDNLDVYKIRDQNTIQEFGLKYSKIYPDVFAQKIQSLKIRDQSVLKQIVIGLTDHERDVISPNIHHFNIADERFRIMIAQNLAEKSYQNVFPNIKNYGIRDTDALRDMFVTRLKTIAGTLCYASDFKISREQTIQYIKQFMGDSPRKFLNEMLFSWPGFPLSPKEIRPFVLEWGHLNPALSLRWLLSNGKDPMHDPQGLSWPKLHAELIKISSESPILVPPHWIGDGIIGNPIQDASVNLKLLNYAMTLKMNYQPDSTAFDVLGDIVESDGIKALKNKKWVKRSSQIKPLFELLLDIQGHLEYPALRYLKIDPVFFDTSENLNSLVTLLTQLRNLMFLSLQKDEEWRNLERKIHFRLNSLGPISPNDLSSIDHLLASELKNKLKGLKISISFDQLMKLQTRLGTIEPIITLISRFKGKEDWQHELPVLGKMIRAYIDNDFEKLKFEGGEDPKERLHAQRQLGGLSEQETLEWKKQRVRVSLVGADTRVKSTENENTKLESIRSEVLSTAQEMLGGQTNQHLLEAKKLPSELRKKITNLIKTQNHLAGRTDQEITEMIHLISSFRAELLGLQILEVASQVIDDLDSVVSYLRVALAPQTQIAENSRRSIIVSASTWAFHTQITIGDRVKTSSCQNYRTGSHIETLLAYGLDANVQSLLSFAIGPDHFEHVGDFDRVFQALSLRSSDVPKIEYDGDLIQLNFHMQDGDKIRTKKLEHGYLRKILKYGRSEKGKKLIRTETPYKQSHPAFGVMESQQSQIVKEMAVAIGASLSGKMFQEESRNPGGIYSDLAGGKKTGKYTIPN